MIVIKRTAEGVILRFRLIHYFCDVNVTRQPSVFH